MFICTVEINSSIAMNINEDISIMMKFNGITLNTPRILYNTLQHKVATQYTCTVTITSTSQYQKDFTLTLQYYTHIAFIFYF